MSAALLVVAKAPVPGLAKTRLAASVGDEAAAELAAAALLDTLDAGEAFAPRDRRIVALTGDVALAARSGELAKRLSHWQVVAQRGSSFAARLVAAHADTAELVGDTALVQIGTDTPQLTAEDLHRLAEAVTADDRLFDAALGPALDGGWWGLATRQPGFASALRDVPMSEPSTGRLTGQALSDAGARVCHLHLLRDVDTADDAAAVAEAAPDTRFGSLWSQLQEVAVR